MAETRLRPEGFGAADSVWCGREQAPDEPASAEPDVAAVSLPPGRWRGVRSPASSQMSCTTSRSWAKMVKAAGTSLAARFRPGTSSRGTARTWTLWSTSGSWRSSSGGESTRSLSSTAVEDLGELVFHAALTVLDGRITYAGPASEAPPPPRGVPVIDGRGGTLLPGFFDCHVHLGMPSEQSLVEHALTTNDVMRVLGTVRRMRLTLDAGITSARDLGALPAAYRDGDDDQIVPYADSGPLSAKLLPQRHPQDLRRVPARHAHHPGRHDQRRPARVHPVLTNGARTRPCPGAPAGHRLVAVRTGGWRAARP